MQHFHHLIKAQYKKVAQRQAKGFGRAVFQLEQVYERIHKNSRASPKDSVSATRQFLLIHLYSADFYFLLFGLTLLAFSTRAFSEPGIDYGVWRPVVITLAGVLAGVIPLILTMVLFPLHVIYRAQIWTLTALNIVVSAIIFSWVEPVIPRYFYHEGILKFRQRHKKRNLEETVPADKRGPLVALSAQDHYVEILTENGSHLNRISMAEAVAMAPAEAGMSVHRSHWVAYNSMVSLNKSAERYHLKLRSGASIPVAKTKVAEVLKYLNSR